jgi:hypothetical protein
MDLTRSTKQKLAAPIFLNMYGTLARTAATARKAGFYFPPVIQQQYQSVGGGLFAFVFNQ